MITSPGIRKTSCALLLSALAGCAATNHGPSQHVVHYPSPDPALASLPFSEAVRVGDLLFLSGQIGNAPGTLQLVEGGIGPESRQTIENIKAILARHGATLDDVVKASVFLADIKEWPSLNEVYREYFKAPYPARSALAGSGLALGARVEIEVIAVIRD